MGRPRPCLGWRARGSDGAFVDEYSCLSYAEAGETVDNVGASLESLLRLTPSASASEARPFVGVLGAQSGLRAVAADRLCMHVQGPADRADAPRDLGRPAEPPSARCRRWPGVLVVSTHLRATVEAAAAAAQFARIHPHLGAMLSQIPHKHTCRSLPPSRRDG
jgi:hypothetical protein